MRDPYEVLEVSKNASMDEIKASYKSGEVSFVIDGNVDEKSIEAKIEETGYKVINYNEEPYEKKPFWKR